MKTTPQTPGLKRLVLVGGGHSHLAVLRQFAMRPLPGLDITLISRDIEVPYSGSLPGYINGSYSLDDILIDLQPLARFAGARLIQAGVEQIDLAEKQILLPGRPAVGFDLLSLNIGSRPETANIPGASHYATGIKPLPQFIKRWAQIREQAAAGLTRGEFILAIVGGGPASVELALAARQRILRDLRGEPATSQDSSHTPHSSHAPQRSPDELAAGLHIVLVSADKELMSTHNEKVRKFIAQELTARNIHIICDYPVTRFLEDGLESGLENDSRDAIRADAIVFATGAAIPEWPGQCGLALTEDGFIAVNSHLQSVSHDFVFATGDVATIAGQPRPKSGVYAVRQGKPLAHNLRNFALGKRLKKYKPQQHSLALLNLSDGTALASRHKLCRHGVLVQKLKHRIDTAFLKKYTRLPEPVVTKVPTGLADADMAAELHSHSMRCAGCGAKLAADTLAQVLGNLNLPPHEDLLNTSAQAEDASIIRLTDNRVLVQSVDQLKAFIHDPWLFARIATNHCLNDLYAMGTAPHSALAVVGLPYAAKTIMRDTMTELMAGCQRELERAGCALAGGHTAETRELLFGLCVNGFDEPQRLLAKQGLQPGDALILSKPLGTGTLLAADMRCKARHRWMNNALNAMLQSNQAAIDIFRSHQIRACTDITGFGLAGHLLEMLSASGMGAELHLSALPVLDGAEDCFGMGITSSLHAANIRSSEHNIGTAHIADVHEATDTLHSTGTHQATNNLHIADSDQTTSDLQGENYATLFDPQTAGGLLGGVPAAEANACLTALHQAGYKQAAIIGQVTAPRHPADPLSAPEHKNSANHHSPLLIIV
ncbi:MAG: selenide, water dikinase SelD [Pseudohongiellaceae bacterium]